MPNKFLAIVDKSNASDSDSFPVMPLDKVSENPFNT